MEDSSLDDFFAKKDKTKKKNRSKLTPSDILAQQETGTKKGKKKKDKESEAAQEERKTTNVIHAEDDDEWVDFEQETETDYSGLRIQNLTIANKEEEEGEEEVNENEDEEDGENREKKDAVSGPWNKSGQPQSTPTPSAPVPEPPKPEPEPPKEEEAKPRKYVPPGARAAQSSTSGPNTPSRLTAKKKRAAPNLQSEDDFPTLGGGPTPEVRAWGSSSESKGDFEKVQSGGRNIDDPNKVSQQLSLGNRYASLQD